MSEAPRPSSESKQEPMCAPRPTIIGTGMYAPKRVVKNDYFDKYYNRDMDTFLREQRNIVSRHFMAEDETTSDMIVPAAEEAIKNAGVSASDIDLVIVATDTPDYVSPSTAAVVQHKMGLVRAGSFDLNTACAGFATALDVAAKFLIADERYQNVLVVGAYGMSKYFDWTDHKVTSVFADGAGAAVVARAQVSGQGILASELYTDGQYHDYMGVYAGGTAFPINEKNISAGLHLLKFAKRIPPETNGLHWPRLTNKILDRIGARVEDVDHFFFTQINIGSITETMERLGQPLSKAHNIMDRFGYTGSACIPMAIADAARSGKLKENDLVMILGSGGGMSMAALALRWSYNT